MRPVPGSPPPTAHSVACHRARVDPLPRSLSLIGRSAPLASARIRVPVPSTRWAPAVSPLYSHAHNTSAITAGRLPPHHPRHHPCASEVWHCFDPCPLSSCPHTTPHRVVLSPPPFTPVSSRLPSPVAQRQIKLVQELHYITTNTEHRMPLWRNCPNYSNLSAYVPP
jgi:hypothetical protein